MENNIQALPLLVGELNPYGDDDHFALYPRPRNASGHRLCVDIMGLSEADYLRRFDRVNLCHGEFSMHQARIAAEGLFRSRAGVMVLLGARVCRAFRVPNETFSVRVVGAKRFVVLPHPSGLCRVWNEPGAVERARKVLHMAGVLP